MNQHSSSGLSYWARVLSGQADLQSPPSAEPAHAPASSPHGPGDQDEVCDALADLASRHVAPDQGRSSKDEESSPREPHRPSIELIAGSVDAWMNRLLADGSAAEAFARRLAASIESAIAESVHGSSQDARDAAVASRAEYSQLRGAIAELTDEIRRQSEAMERLPDALSPLADVATALHEIAALRQALHESLERFPMMLAEREAEARAAKADSDRLRASLLDLYVHLHQENERCQEYRRQLVAPAKRRWLSWPRRHAVIDEEMLDALQESCSLTLQRLAESLREHRITPVGRCGDPFDARTMLSVGAGDEQGAVEGFVRDVLEPGFVRDDEVLRRARVRITE